MTPSLAQAQDTATSVQRVEITGSSIKRVDAETALPVQTVTREQIETLGVTNTEQLLQNISANSTAGGMTSQQNAGQSTYGEATASLRGLGSQRTLVLVNGRRIANYATDGTAVDINSIPLSAIDRVEVLKDGASGVYGSDAVAGVINFILRKDFHGVEMTAYYGKPTTAGGGKSGKVGMVAGFGDIDKDHVAALFSLDVAHDSAIQGYQRNYAKRSWSDDGLFDISATATGAIRTFDPNMLTTLNQGKALYADGSGIGNILGPTSPSSTANNCTANGMSFDVNLNTCRYNPSPLVPLTPDVTRVNVSGTLRGRINDDNEWFAEVFASNAKTTISEQSSPYSASFLATDPLFHKLGINPDILINANSPYYPTAYINAVNAQNAAYNAANPTSPQKPIVAPGDPVAVSYRAVDGGGRIHTDNSTLYHFATGLNGTLKDWDYDASYSRNESVVSESTQRGYQNQTQLVELLSGNNAFDPFAAQQSPALAAQIMATNYNGNIIKSSLTTDAIDLKVTHDLMKLPGGALAFAAGVSFRKEALDLRPSAAYQSGDVSGYGAAVLPFSASRNSHSIYGELDAPFLKMLEADLSVRNDHYPNASSTNPKFSLKFLPIDQVAFRGSVGTGFREPSLPELFTPLAPATTSIFTDPVTGVPGQFNQEVGGNPQLVPEKSKQFSLGTIVEPVKGLSASADYYHVRVDHAIIALDAQTVVNLAAAGNPVYVPLVSRDSSGNITNIVTKNVNSGGVVTAGVDIDVKWNGFRTPVGQFGAELAGTWIQKYDLTTIDGTVQHSVGRTTDTADSAINAVTNGGMIFRWKHALTANWKYGGYGLALTQNYQSSYKDAPPAIDDCDPRDYTAPDAPPSVCSTGRRVGAFATYDLQGEYSGLKNLSFRLGLKNMFDRQPPRVTTNGTYFQTGYDPTYYDPHGRFVYGSATYKF
ncbi:TonB-dependent receptor domain-containing protein [Scleromatobacter humisilvae]|uniref:TonB-dependent receptor n=1 Tax=Scleromatobacter humisilvae TaxID=2897159 RepID=A0A9X1YMZ7_9BURK|nr:TonB-dependent receptor [Scleromatobacter humisilvae]MCK9687940.1 TonB-dependent receptor [Scleromatobacter humisilvae]